jgi:anti-anti-sigma factor
MGHGAMDYVANPFSAHIEERDGRVVVVVIGELDLDSTAPFSEVLDPLLEDGPSEVLVDASGLSFIDSSGVAALVNAQNRLAKRGAHLTVRSPRPQAQQVFAITNLVEFLQVVAEERPDDTPP